MQPQPLLELSRVRMDYRVPNSGRRGGKRAQPALVDFDLAVEESAPRIVAIAGESGSGKSTVCSLAFGLLQPSAGRVAYRGADLSRLDQAGWRRFRRDVQVVFQDPFAAFNPFYRIGHVFDLPARNLLREVPAAALRERIEESLDLFGLRAAEVLDKYPHQLSGGQRQRIMFARAYMLRPKLIIADEPVSMIDANLRSAVLRIMLRLKEEKGVSFIYVTHDLNTAYQAADEIVMLYKGVTVERGSVEQVIMNPAHPYVRLLVDSIPPDQRSASWRAPVVAPGGPASASGEGCVFVSRCLARRDACSSVLPRTIRMPDGRAVRCHLHDAADALEFA